MQMRKTLKLSNQQDGGRINGRELVLNMRHLSFSSIHLLCGMFQSVSNWNKWIFKLQLGTNQAEEPHSSLCL